MGRGSGRSGLAKQVNAEVLVMNAREKAHAFPGKPSILASRQTNHCIFLAITGIALGGMRPSGLY